LSGDVEGFFPRDERDAPPVTSQEIERCVKRVARCFRVPQLWLVDWDTKIDVASPLLDRAALNPIAELDRTRNDQSVIHDRLPLGETVTFKMLR
jgi:hypothetical protein